MPIMKILAFVPVACLIACLVALADGKKPRTIPGGSWGGQHIRLSVAGGSASIEYDCANGKINGPLKIDSRGRFTLRGAHVRERGGPVRSDEVPERVPAEYTGKIDGKRMTLTVTLLNPKNVIGTFELTHGSQGRVFKCL